MTDLRTKQRQSAKPALLITGSSGLLGHPLSLLARRQWSVYGVYRHHEPQVASINTVQQDLVNPDKLEQLLDTLRPQAVIHAAAAARADDCQARPRQTEAINVVVPQHLAALCAQRQIPFILISTDLVFDGKAGPYDEQHPCSALSAYSQQKVRAESGVLHRYSGALVCRLPLLFGLAPYAQNNFSVQMLAAIARRTPLRLFVDEYRTPVDNFSAARGILGVLGRARGILHLGGRTRVSRHELGCMMAKAMGVAPDMIVPVTLADAQLAYPRSPDCSLDSRKAFSLGYDPMPLDRAVGQMVKLYLEGRWTIG